MGPETSIDPKWFRHVLGQYPTGVTAVTAIGADGEPMGLAIGSFTSVSLDPPLVGFLPDRSSSTWPKVQAAGRFCVNILSAEQEHVCRAFASKGADKFAGVSWRAAPSGVPVIDGAVAWIDCDLEAVYDAGDHEFVMGRVRELDISSPTLPLLFFQGGYGHFRPLSLAVADADLVTQLRVADIARPHMERLAAEHGGECIANALSGEEVVVIASAGRVPGDRTPTRVGQRLPFMPPFGMLFVAWAGEAAPEAWLRRRDKNPTAEALATVTAAAARVRERGYTLRVRSDSDEALEHELAGTPTRDPRGGWDSFTPLAEALVARSEPETLAGEPVLVRSIAVAVRSASGEVLLALGLVGFAEPLLPAEIEAQAMALQDVAGTITRAASAA